MLTFLLFRWGSPSSVSLGAAGCGGCCFLVSCPPSSISAGAPRCQHSPVPAGAVGGLQSSVIRWGCSLFTFLRFPLWLLVVDLPPFHLGYCSSTVVPFRLVSLLSTFILCPGLLVVNLFPFQLGLLDVEHPAFSVGASPCQPCSVSAVASRRQPSSFVRWGCCLATFLCCPLGLPVINLRHFSAGASCCRPSTVSAGAAGCRPHRCFVKAPRRLSSSISRCGSCLSSCLRFPSGPIVVEHS